MRPTPKPKRTRPLLSASTRRGIPFRAPDLTGRDDVPVRGSFNTKGLKEKARAYVRELKRSHPVCIDCKMEWPPYVLEFDHVDPTSKKFNVGDASSAPSMEALVAEAEKCDLVCSNCHKIREHKRRRKKGQFSPEDGD